MVIIIGYHPVIFVLKIPAAEPLTINGLIHSRERAIIIILQNIDPGGVGIGHDNQQIIGLPAVLIIEWDTLTYYSCIIVCIRIAIVLYDPDIVIPELRDQQIIQLSALLIIKGCYLGRVPDANTPMPS